MLIIANPFSIQNWYVAIETQLLERGYNLRAIPSDEQRMNHRKRCAKTR